MQAAAFQERVSEFGYWFALEDESQADGNHVPNDNGQNSEDGVSKGLIRVEAEIEEWDGH